MNPYHVLGVQPSATTAEIKSAHRGGVKRLHPDAGGDPNDFAEFQSAYEVLIDPARRRRFDETGSTERLRFVAEQGREIASELAKAEAALAKVNNLRRRFRKGRGKRAAAFQPIVSGLEHHHRVGLQKLAHLKAAKAVHARVKATFEAGDYQVDPLAQAAPEAGYFKIPVAGLQFS